MDDTNNQYQALKKNIKDFIRTQNTDKKKKWFYYCSFIYVLKFSIKEIVSSTGFFL